MTNINDCYIVEKEYAAYFFAASQVMLIKKWLINDLELTSREMVLSYHKWAVKAMVNNYF